ncbi:MAG: phosphoribosylformylglycinamidine synthase I [Rhodobacteraceae bacterium TMED111]|nr:phosphoribosylformylglycinamidine synthase I [Marinovum sp.]OUV43671.1 MAG: phosphoribosylformylglycinamidine synthase I [Rhodobacteraceae bacterium TMED111]|tara:strand:+ start:2217 stop:2876 length:660 start_codon:yes stop_codon:yes gene_type:complete
MRAAVIVFPGSNCDRDMVCALNLAGHEVISVWHKETELPKNIDLIAIPGGFSFGDYLRCGAIAAKSPIFKEVLKHIERGGYALGVCNGFQILTEAGVLPGILQQNINTKFISKVVDLRVLNTTSIFTHRYTPEEPFSIPIAHHEGNYFASSEDLKKLKDGDRIAFKYIKNPNGALEDIAGILSENHRVLGMMPHPERHTENVHGCQDGFPFFEGLFQTN